MNWAEEPTVRRERPLSLSRARARVIETRNAPQLLEISSTVRRKDYCSKDQQLGYGTLRRRAHTSRSRALTWCRHSRDRSLGCRDSRAGAALGTAARISISATMPAEVVGVDGVGGGAREAVLGAVAVAVGVGELVEGDVWAASRSGSLTRLARCVEDRRIQ